MATIARIIGGAGTGKTTRLLEIMEKVLSTGVYPTELGFVSFTRAARREAAQRAASKFDLGTSVLEQDGWFKTLHAVCYRCLGCKRGDILADDRDSTKWLEESLQAPVKSRHSEEEPFVEGYVSAAEDEAGTVLSLWSACRNRLEPLKQTWRAAYDCNDLLPNYERTLEIIERYEQAKRLDGRSDFVDLLGLYSGWRFGVLGHERREPDGWAPDVPVWFLDEQQDTSRLLDAVCRRLIEPAKWVYVAADPFQSIYGWAGADPKHFMAWPAAKEYTMPQSYRCPSDVLSLGEDILRECSDYWDRGIKPAAHDGCVEADILRRSLFDDIDPCESWLILARSNYHCKRLASYLDRRGLPWLPTRGNNHWGAPRTRAAVMSLYGLERQGVMEGGEWSAVLDRLPSRLDGQPLLTHGTKARFDQPGELAKIARRVFRRHEIAELGATEKLVELIANGRWRSVVDEADRFVDAVERYGYAAVESPGIKISTVHAAKGMEADNVLWLTSTSQQTDRAMETQEGADAERRVNYVAVTRARKRLIVARERCRYSAEVPA